MKETIFGKTKPHAFSWLVWGILQVAVFFASTSKGGGTGAWAIGATAVLDFVIFGISLFKGEKEITRLDKTSLIVALLGMGLWVVTTDPIWSVLIATGVDVVGFLPTFRKAYKRPEEESITVYTFGAMSFAISLFALQAVNITTFLYPASIVISNAIFVTMVICRRSVKAKRQPRKSKR